jgi:hypothetical protein
MAQRKGVIEHQIYQKSQVRDEAVVISPKVTKSVGK